MGPTVINPTLATRNAAAYWQLALLAGTSVALSIASGWTTWDGMKNFTDNSVLSLLITFGIQGVMLIAAWLIGEAFAASGRDAARERRRGRRQLNLGILLGAFGALLLLALLAEGFLLRAAGLMAAWPWHALALAALVAGVGSLALRRLRRSATASHATSAISLTSLLKHASLWIMFLTCLIASVFFSFDSLFDTLFSPDDRKRTSHARVQGEVATLLSGISNEVSARRQNAIAQLFASETWAAYDRKLSGLAAQAMEAEVALRADAKTARRRSEEEIAAEMRAIAAAEARAGVLDAQIASLREELSASASELSAAEAIVQNRKRELTALRTELLAKAAEAEAEAAGAGVTGIVGRGPKFREIKQEETQLKISESLAEKLLAEAEREHSLQLEKRDQLTTRMLDLEAKSASERNAIEAGNLRIAALRSGEELPDLRKAGEQMHELNEAKLSFVAAPTADGFRALQRRCMELAVAPAPVPGAAQRPENVCDAGTLTELTDAVFAANAARAALARECGSEIALSGLSTEELLRLGQKCVQLAGLPDATAAAFQSRLRQASLRRDDRAHRFIVTWNAFFDRNQLAFVALFIAIAMDGLIFMSGLYGANARAEIEAGAAGAAEKGLRRSELVLDAALLPDPPERARMVFEAIDFSKSGRNAVGEVDVGHAEPARANALRAVLNAAMAVGMARPLPGGSRYAVNAELIELLSARIEQGRGRERFPSGGVPSNLLRLSLGHGGPEAILLLLRTARPLPPGQEFTHEIEIGWLRPDAEEPLLAILNAGMASGSVSSDAEGPDRYLLRPSFFLALAQVASAAMRSGPEPAAAPPAVDAAQPLPALAKPAAVSDSEETRSADDARGFEEHAEISADEKASPASLLPVSDVASDQREGNDAARPISPAGARDDRGAAPGPEAMSLSTNGSGSSAHRSSPAIAVAPRRWTGKSEPAGSATLLRLSTASGERLSRNGGEGPASIRLGWPNEAVDEARLPEHVLTALHRATGLSRTEIAELADPRTGFAYAAACKALQSLRESHDKLDRTLRNLEQAIWMRIHEFARTTVRASTGAEADPFSDAARKLVAKSFPRIFLRWRGLRETQLWCEGFVAEHEVLAQTAGIPPADAQRLRRIAQSLPALMEVDEQNRSAWSDLICRINGLRERQAGDPAVEELMP